jgi:hypothetical protein
LLYYIQSKLSTAATEKNSKIVIIKELFLENQRSTFHVQQHYTYMHYLLYKKREKNIVR